VAVLIVSVPTPLSATLLLAMFKIPFAPPPPLSVIAPAFMIDGPLTVVLRLLLILSVFPVYSGSASAEFFVLLGAGGKVEDVKFVNGADARVLIVPL
jgi:hypothetical protein